MGGQYVEDKSIPAPWLWGLLALGGVMLLVSLLRKQAVAHTVVAMAATCLLLWLRLPLMRAMAVFWGVFVVMALLNRKRSWDEQPGDFLCLVFGPFLILGFALIPVDQRIYTLRAESLDYELPSSYGHSNAPSIESVDRAKMNARVVHYADSDSRVWFFESHRGGKFNLIVVDGYRLFRGPDGSTVTGDELGRRIAAWSGAKVSREEYKPIPGLDLHF